MCGSAFFAYFLPIGSFGPRLPRHNRGQDRKAHHADTPISPLGTEDRSAMYIRLIIIMTVAVAVKTLEIQYCRYSTHSQYHDKCFLHEA